MVADNESNAATSNMAQLLDKKTQVAGSGTIVIDSKFPRGRGWTLPTCELKKKIKKSCYPQPFRKNGPVRRRKQVAPLSSRVYTYMVKWDRSPAIADTVLLFDKYAD